jgi:HSP20 family protein
MLMRFDPFRDFDRLAEQVFGTARTAPWIPMDAVRREHEVELHFDLPGVRPDSIDVTVEKNVLTVRAERAWYPAEGDEVLARERPQGTFTRQVLLGEALDTDAVSATYTDGVLTVRIPVAEQAKPRKIEITRGSSGPVEVTS